MATTFQVPAVLETSTEKARSAQSPAVKAFVLALGLRILYSLFAALSSPYLRLDPRLIAGNSLTGHLISRQLHPLLYALFGVWERFDTLWYTQIARHGYDSPMAAVFYPLYPGLIRAISLNPQTDLAAALVVSTAASFFLFWGALRLFELDHPPAIAFRSILLWGVWPASFVFFAGYPDSLLCALTVWCLYFARSRQWFLAGTLGLLTGCTKALGCFTALPLLWMAWRQRSRKGLIAALACVVGTGCFQGWLAAMHFPPVTEIYRTYWATSTVAPWTSVRDAVSYLASGGDRLLLLNLGVLAVVGAAALIRPVRFEYKVYAVAAVCLCLTKHTEPLLQSTARYSLAVFGAFPALSSRLHRGLPFAIVVFVSAILNLVLFLTFLDWGLAI